MKKSILFSIFLLLTVSLFNTSVFAKEGERDEKKSTQKQEVINDNSESNTTTEQTSKETNSISDKSLSTNSANWQTMTMGGGKGTSSRFGLTSAVGQSLSGTGTTGSLVLSSSFFQNFSLGPISCCIGDRGNIDSDPNDIFDISDVVYLINWLFNDGPGPICKDEANVVIEDPDIADLVYFISYMFSDGPAPPACAESPVI